LSRAGNFGIDEEIEIRKRGTNSWIVNDVRRNPGGTGGTLTVDGTFRINTFTATGSSTFTVS